ncbi:hypothetical protein FP507_02420 [Chlorobium phaeovibrioides]|uniref:Uncharacterized protein n=1 Tax=Chlorobium phaeovibrioides TaxID=1094 RepID=A0A5M8ICK3_CHLPH|nr:hypothetical protein [Chlorobium phaeovibrioides]KAA6232079.1 hypothetical protein FP507_02420 [Chlorobium phaeovibrioides]
MSTNTLSRRHGQIDDVAVEFTVTPEFEGGKMVAAEGVIQRPDDYHGSNWGTIKTLMDLQSGLRFSIHVAEERFTFFSLESVAKLFAIEENHAR